jgi:hypothetical protein
VNKKEAAQLRRIIDEAQVARKKANDIAHKLESLLMDTHLLVGRINGAAWLAEKLAGVPITQVPKTIVRTQQERGNTP